MTGFVAFVFAIVAHLPIVFTVIIARREQNFPQRLPFGVTKAAL
jgi:hypothetical protein